jgi:ubiquinone/menaquinone biosynthesis C-methylase UbiE
VSGQRFDCVASEYDAVRPDYPSQLFDALESAMGQPLLDTDVLDVGAGTGIASRALAGRGARVVAVDPGAAMLHVLRSRSTSRVRLVQGDGNALPLRSRIFDLVVFAQSLHWVDLARADSEAFRVLKEGGVFAAWWNQHDLSVPWVAAHHERLSRTSTEPDFDQRQVVNKLAQPPRSRRLATVEIPWSRSISLEQFGRLLHTHSRVFTLGEDADAVVEHELRALAHIFPDGVLEEPFKTYAVLARA